MMRARNRWLEAAAGRTAWLLAAWAVAGAVVRADDDHAVEAGPPDLRAIQQQQQEQNRVDLGKALEASVFEGTNGRGGLRPSPTGGDTDQAAEPAALAAARQVAERRLARVEEVCGLSEQQGRKLRLAMESDIRRLAEELDAMRRTYAGESVNFSQPAGQRKWQEFQQDVQRCRQRIRNLFNADSLYAKVLSTTLDAAQLATFTADMRERRSFRWKALVVAAMQKIDNSLGLDQKQYDAIEGLLLAKEPPLRVDGMPSDREDPHVQQMLVFMMLSEIDGAALRSAVSPRQWATLATLTNQGKAMRSFIEAQGVLEKSAP